MKRNWKSLVLILIITFILMVLVVIYTARAIYRTSFSYVHELGDDKTSAITAELENYLENAKSVLWVAADSVDHMVDKGATTDEIVEYITRESSNTEAQFDESYTGIYGVINGVYVDGVGWEPPDDYNPIERDWYKTAVGANGEIVIVSPYIDAQTGNVIISIGKSLTDPNNALALDLTLSGVQETAENININGNGYGFIMNNDGMVIAHPDKDENGKMYNELPKWKDLYEKVTSIRKGNFDMMIDGEACTVFVDEVMDQWHLVIVTKSSELLEVPMNLLVVSILITLLVFGITSATYIFGYRYERRVNDNLEKMKETEQRREYEAKILKLEKSAADTANKAKSDFLADMSHEIRTPINAVLGMNEMILRESEDESIQDYASNIKKAGNTLLSIINTILDFSKIEDGMMHLVPVEFDMVDMLDGLVHSIDERAREKDLEFIVNVEERIPEKLCGDDVRITQVIMNLLTNAVKYTEKGSVTLRLSETNETDNKVNLLVEVIDTGIGIKEEDLDKLAISFERIEEKRNRHIEGTGLGISIVTKLLAMMDSELKVESVYGKGSRFYFELELEVADRTPIGVYDAKRKVESVKAASNSRLIAPEARVIVTDDNEMNRKVISNLLKLFSVKPTICSSGEETIEKLRENRYDLLFLDHMMPRMDGIETLKHLKEEKLLDGIAVVALTANAVVGAREQYLQAGFDGYLSKPINLDDLEGALREYLPKGKWEIISTDEAEASEGTISTSEAAGELKGIDYLRSLGINIEEGISFSGGEEEFYLEIIRDYAEAAEGKCSNLDGFYQNEDWVNYKILVHSIKSSSKTVGVTYLFENARKLEEASGARDIDYVKANHDQLIKDYKEIAQKIISGLED